MLGVGEESEGGGNSEGTLVVSCGGREGILYHRLKFAMEGVGSLRYDHECEPLILQRITHWSGFGLTTHPEIVTAIINTKSHVT